LINPLKEFSDVEDIITRNWTTREAMITAAGADPGRFKRLLGLTVSLWVYLETVQAEPRFLSVGALQAATDQGHC
jgi:hypothetical protein